MASELGLIYSTDKRSTRSMIDLGRPDWGNFSPTYSDSEYAIGTSEEYELSKMFSVSNSNLSTERKVAHLVASWKRVMDLASPRLSRHRRSGSGSTLVPSTGKVGITRTLLNLIRGGSQRSPQSPTNSLSSEADMELLNATMSAAQPCDKTTLLDLAALTESSSASPVSWNSATAKTCRVTASQVLGCPTLSKKPSNSDNVLVLTIRKRLSLSDSAVLAVARDDDEMHTNLEGTLTETPDHVTPDCEFVGISAEEEIYPITCEPSPAVDATLGTDSPCPEVVCISLPDPVDDDVLGQIQPPISEIQQTSEVKFTVTDDDADMTLSTISEAAQEGEPLTSDTLSVGEMERSETSSSLSSLKRKSSITKHKSVRFADEVGSSLTETRIIADTQEPPRLQRGCSIFDDDYDLNFFGDQPFGRFCRIKPYFSRQSRQKTAPIAPPPVPGIQPAPSSECNRSGSTSDLLPLNQPEQLTWRITFPQPAAQYLAFRQRLESNCVSLENVSIAEAVTNDTSISLSGTVKVKNVAFEKRVWLRVTTNEWSTYTDYLAEHSEELSALGGVNNRFETFMFNFSINIGEKANKATTCPNLQLVNTLPPPPVTHQPTCKFQFAVGYQAGPEAAAGEFWDNNDNCNYVVVKQFMPPSPYQLPHSRDSTSKQYPSPRLKSVISHYTKSHSAESSLVAERSLPLPSSPPSIGNISPTLNPQSAYTLDFRPNFGGFSSLTSYSSWRHYTSEISYY